VTAGQVNECTRAESVIGQAVACLIGRRRKRRKRRHKPKKLAGDKGYSVPRLRDWIKRQKIEPVIPAQGQREGAVGSAGQVRQRSVSWPRGG